MKNKDIETVEKKLIATLQTSEQKPNLNILAAAKSELKLRKTPKKRIVFRCALAICALIILSLAIVLPLTIRDNDGGIKELNYSSMYEYFKNNNIDINTYDHLFDKNWGSAGGGVPGEKSPYIAEECILGQYKEKDLYIKQKYNYAQKDIISVTVLLVDDNDVKQTTFGDYLNLEKSVRFMKVNINYYFDIETKTGKAAFVYKDKDFYIESECESEAVMLNHIQALIISQ